MVVGHSLLLARLPGTHLSDDLRDPALKDVCLRLVFVFTVIHTAH